MTSRDARKGERIPGRWKPDDIVHAHSNMGNESWKSPMISTTYEKEVYADKLENLIPDGVKLLNKIPFAKQSQQTGNLR